MEIKKKLNLHIFVIIYTYFGSISNYFLYYWFFFVPIVTYRKKLCYLKIIVGNIIIFREFQTGFCSSYNMQLLTSCSKYHVSPPAFSQNTLLNSCKNLLMWGLQKGRVLCWLFVGNSLQSTTFLYLQSYVYRGCILFDTAKTS